MKNDIPNILTEEQFFKYMRCPLQFYLEEETGIVPPKVETRTFIQSLDFVTRAFCHKLMEGEVMSQTQVKKLWDKECKQNSFDMKVCVEGWGKLAQMYQWSKRVQLRILDLGIPYRADVAYNEYHFTVKGIIPIIGVTQAGEAMLLIWYWNERKILQTQLDTNLKYTLWCYAFYQQTHKNIGILLHNVKHSEDLLSYRGQFDYQRLIKSVGAIGVSIMNKLWYPREGPLCNTCYLLGACRSWK